MDWSSIVNAVLPVLLVIVQVFHLLFSGALFQKPLIDDGSSASLAVYDRDIFRAQYLSKSYYDNFWFENARVLTFNPHKGVASCWEMCGLLSLSYKNAVLDKTYLPTCEKVLDGLRYYRRVVNGQFGGYSYARGFYRNGADKGVSYDDEMWLARDFIALYELAGDKKYLCAAVEIADYIIREAFVDLDPQIFISYGFTVDTLKPLGGFYWNDSHQALHVCSNGPAVQLLAALYRLTGNATYLKTAEKSYNFLQYLVKPSGVFYDLMVFRKDSENNITGIIHPDGPSYSYNSGSPVTGAVELYKATGDASYLATAEYWARSADTYFAKDSGIAGVKSYPGGNVWFNLILLNGYFALAPFDPAETAVFISHMQQSIDYAYDHFLKQERTPFNGAYLPANWVNGWGDKGTADVWALDAGSQAEIYATLAIYQQSLVN